MSDASGLDNFWGSASMGDAHQAGRSTATLTSLFTAAHDGRRFAADEAPPSSTRFSGFVPSNVLTHRQQRLSKEGGREGGEGTAVIGMGQGQCIVLDHQPAACCGATVGLWR